MPEFLNHPRALRAPLWPAIAITAFAALVSFVAWGTQLAGMNAFDSRFAAVELHSFLETLTITTGMLTLALGWAYYRGTRQPGAFLISIGLFFSALFHAIHLFVPHHGPASRFLATAILTIALACARFGHRRLRSRSGRLTRARARFEGKIIVGSGIALTAILLTLAHYSAGPALAPYFERGTALLVLGPYLAISWSLYRRHRSPVTYALLLAAIPNGISATQRLHSGFRDQLNVFLATHVLSLFAVGIIFAGFCLHALRTYQAYRDTARERQDSLNHALRRHAEDLLNQIENRTIVEKALMDNLELFEQLVRTFSHVFWMSDADRQSTLYVSPGYEKVWQRPCQTLYENARAFLDHVHPDDRDRVKLALSKLSLGLYDEEYRIILPDGSVRWVRDRGFPVEKGDGTESKVERIVGIAEDITYQKEAEQIIAEQRLKMVSSSKMSSLGEMAGGIAHEINNPLAVIHTRAGQLKELAEMGEIDHNLVRQTAERIEQTVMRISKIVKGLRSFARDGEADPFQVAGLHTIVYDTIEFCREKFKHHSIDLSIGEIPENLEIECRPTQVSQLLLNLIGNAYDAVEKLPEKWIRLDVLDEGHSLKILITDSGGGIPRHIAERIFQPFFTTKDIGKGTGLGLSICKGILEGHGGDLTVDPSCPHTRFVIHLPKRQAYPLSIGSKPAA